VARIRLFFSKPQHQPFFVCTSGDALLGTAQQFEPTASYTAPLRTCLVYFFYFFFFFFFFINFFFFLFFFGFLIFFFFFFYFL